MYNLKEAHKVFVRSAAYLARDMGFDPDKPTTEARIERWRESTMKLIAQHHAAHEDISRLHAAIKEKDDALSDLLDGEKWHSIQENTGLSEERCREIASMKRFLG